MKACGHVFKYGDNVDTDVIIPARYLNATQGEELAKHCMEDIDKEFIHKVKKGDLIVANKNFGCGSSREQAATVIAANGVRCVIAKSFARIFFRNGFNSGILLLQNDEIQSACKEGDIVTVDVEKNTISVNGKEFTAKKVPENLFEIVNDGGLIEHCKKLNRQKREGK